MSIYDYSGYTDPDLQEEEEITKAISRWQAAPAVGGATGSAVGGLTGGLLGSVIPGVGTAIGAGLGSAAGSGLGGLLGNLISTLNTDAETEKLKNLQAARLGPLAEKQAKFQALQSLLGKYNHFQ